MPTAPAPAPPRTRRRARTGRTGGFVLVGATLLLVLAASSAPTPVYPLYASTYGATPAVLTVIFAVYALVLLLTLMVAGRLSDHLGRRPVLVAAMVLEVISMALFLLAGGVGALVLARVVQGLATGLVISTAGAALLDLEPARRAGLGALVNGVAATFGLALGALGSGLLVELAPHPTRLVFAVLLAVFVALTVALLTLHEPVSATRGALASLRPHVAVPASHRARFVAVAPAFVAVWAMGGLYLSLGPSLAHSTLGATHPLTGALLVTTFTGAGALATLLARKAAAYALLTCGSAILAAGTVVALVAIGTESLWTFAIGSAMAGSGFGTTFVGALRTVVAGAAPKERAGLLTAVYLLSYLSFSLPAVLAGVLVEPAGLSAVATGYGVVVTVLALVALGLAVRRRAAETDR